MLRSPRGGLRIHPGVHPPRRRARPGGRRLRLQRSYRGRQLQLSLTSGGGGGRGGGGHHTTTYFNNTCHWDLFGNLTGSVSGAPTAPKPISSVNGLTIYARNAKGDTTGVDGARGFVNTAHAQYAWVSPGGYVFLNNQKPVNLTLTVRSVGDFPWSLYRATATANLAMASVKSTTCARSGVRSGVECAIVVTYDPSGIPGGDNPYTAYDHLSVSLVSNSGQAPVFAESIEAPISPAD